MSEANEEAEGQNSKDDKSPNFFLTLMAKGEWMLRKGEHKLAADSFTAALDLKPDDKKCLIGRSKCYMKMDQFECALQDAEAVLRDDKSDVQGLYQKAEALYFVGHFELALVFYSRGFKVRPQMQEFRLGAQKAEEAIENTAGSPEELEIDGDLSFLFKDEESTQAIQNLMKEKRHPTPKTHNAEKMTRELLGKFYDDKKFLEHLMKDEELVQGVTKRGERLQDIIQRSLTSLDMCAGLWSLEKPVSSQQQRQSSPSELAPFVLKSLSEIDAELTSGDAQASLKKAEKVMKVVEKWSKKEVPNKDELLSSLHSYIGKASFVLGDVDKALKHHRKDLQLAEQCQLPEATSRALDNIGQMYAQTGQLAQAIEFWEQMIPLVSGGLEKTWLFHKIGSCYLELNHYDEARDCGVRSLAAAEEIADEKWQLNANVLVAQAEFKIGNIESSVSHFEKALSIAEFTEDEAAVDAVKKVLDESKQLSSD